MKNSNLLKYGLNITIVLIFNGKMNAGIECRLMPDCANTEISIVFNFKLLTDRIRYFKIFYKSMIRKSLKNADRILSKFMSHNLFVKPAFEK